MDDIKFDKRNYRKHSDKNKAMISKSLSECGAGRSILIDSEGEIIAGNGVYEQAKAKGIPVKVVETDGSELVVVKRTDLKTEDEKRKKLALADNATSDRVEWDMDTISVDFDDCELGEWGIECEVEKPCISTDVQDDDFNESEEEIEKRVQLGDIWQLGNHRLMCGDSCDSEQVKQLLDGQQADMWLTDPPYNVALGYEGGASEQRQRHRRSDSLKIMNDSMPDADFREFLRKAYETALNNIKPGAAFYIWHASNETYNFIGALRDNGAKLRQILIWVKNTITLGRQDFQWKHEPCLYGWKEGGGSSLV